MSRSAKVTASVTGLQYAWLVGHARSANMKLADYIRARLFEDYDNAASYDLAEQMRVKGEAEIILAERKAGVEEDALTRIKREKLLAHAYKLGVLYGFEVYYAQGTKG